MSAPAGAALRGLAGRRFLIRWRGINIPSYTAMLYLGCVAGAFAGAAVAGSAGLEPRRFGLAAIILLAPALAGARLWFVLEHWSLYRHEPHRIWRRSEGGAALYGGLLMGVAASVPLLGQFGLPFWAFWDAASFTMLVGLVFARGGCLMHGCCAGRPTAHRLGIWLPDHRGVWRRRIPTQLLEAGWAAVVLAVAALARPVAPFAGAVFLAVLAAYGGGRLLLEPTRAEADSPGSRANIALSALLALGGTSALLTG